jgi:outer membrane beta-barrel protein
MKLKNLVLFCSLFGPIFAQGETKLEKIETKTLKKKYLENVEDPSVTVIQNRLYTKSYKLNIGGFYNTVIHDPFLDTTGFGANVGFSISEYFIIEGIYLKFCSQSSKSAVRSVKEQIDSNVVVNVNPFSQLIGGQLLTNIIYGKLSLLSSVILYFDLYLVIGAGKLQTKQTSQVDTSMVQQDIFTWWIGIGQQIFITKYLALRIDYRFLPYTENIYKQNTAFIQGNKPIANRSTYGNITTIGVNFYLF